MKNADWIIKHGNKFAYDRMDNDDDHSTRSGTHWSIIAARAVLSDLGDRRGVGHELDAVDEDIREEMVVALAEVIALTEANREQYTATEFSTVEY